MKRSSLYGSLPLVFLAQAALGQATASLAGTIKDATGAVLPGATVLVHNNGTGADRSASADSAGEFVLPSLAPGDYRVVVSAPGFGSYIVRNYILQIDQKATLDVPLAPASAGQTVEVEGTAPALQTETITVGQVIDARTVQEVPLNGRHFLDLTVLTARCHGPGNRIAHLAQPRPRRQQFRDCGQSGRLGELPDQRREPE